MMQVVREGILDCVSVEDSGCAVIAELSDPQDSGLFVRIQSWSVSQEHAEIQQFLNKRVRITIETLD